MSMIICPHCGERAGQGGRFCNRCGTGLAGAEESLTFGSLEEANEFLRANTDISRINTNCVCTSGVGPFAGRIKLERVELTVQHADKGGAVMYRIAEHDYMSPFAPADELLRGLRRLNPNVRMAAVQTLKITGGRALGKISGAGGTKHMRVFITYAAAPDGDASFNF